MTFASKSSVGPSYAANGQEDHKTYTNLNHGTIIMMNDCYSESIGYSAASRRGKRRPWRLLVVVRGSGTGQEVLQDDQATLYNLRWIEEDSVGSWRTTSHPLTQKMVPE